MEIDAISILMVVLFSSIALATDLKNRRIPNWLTVSSALMGLMWHLWSDGLAGAATSLGGFATGFGLLLVLWVIGGGGGGDVKLMGAVGAWLGAFSTLLVFAGSAGFAIVCTIGLVTWNRMQPKLTGSDAAASQQTESDDEAEKDLRPRITVPYALPVALAIWSLFVVHLIQTRLSDLV